MILKQFLKLFPNMLHLKTYFAHVCKIIQMVMSHTHVDSDFYLIMHVRYLKHNRLPFNANVIIVIHINDI